MHRATAHSVQMNVMNYALLLVVVAALAAPANAHEVSAANEMAAAANNFVASLDPEQKAATVFPLDHDHRLNWHFIPMERKGIALKEMTPQQRHLTTALLATSLSGKGLFKATSIMSLEHVLQAIEGSNRRFSRDPELYHVSIFGEPGAGKTWAWRFEGHHLSLSFTIVKGQHIAATPSMMGTNPAIVPSGPHEGLQILADEENVARRLAKSLTPEQKSKAVVSEEAPPDLLTHNDRKISPLEPAGIGWSELNADQQKMVWRLVRTYVRRNRGEIADADLKKIADAGQENIHFAWAGSMQRGQGHYYRIQGPTFLIEYDNTQNNANHVHTVYRDFTEDFGVDLLKLHYEEEHSGN